MIKTVERKSLCNLLTVVKSHKLALTLTCINLAVMAVVQFRPPLERPVAAESQQVPKVIRAQTIELVGERGQARAQLFSRYEWLCS
jgi:hypothetical protein